jgi:putative acetyltransferase
VITVRPERPGDEAAIHAVHAAAFPTAAEAGLVDALRTAGRLSVSLVGVVDDRVVGHVAFSPVALADTPGGLGLAPVGVRPAFQRRGIAAELIRDGLAACARAGAGFVVVLGEPDYYARFAFLPARRWGVRDEYGGGDAFQALELRPRALGRCGAVARYAPEFAALG